MFDSYRHFLFFFVGFFFSEFRNCHEHAALVEAVLPLD